MEYNILYLLVLIILFYYIISNNYQKYYNQENFDPSLVPVSSIVTLAKVAQKIVDGNDILTNPSNLQIGLPSEGAFGNLYVTGTHIIDGLSTFNNTVNINGNANFIGNNTLTGNSTMSGKLTTNSVITNQYNDSTATPRIQLFTDGINYYNSGPGNLHHFRGNNGNVEGGNVLIDQDLSVNGNSTINGSSTVSGTSTLNGDTSINNRLHISGASSTPAGSGDMTTHFNHSDGNNYIRGNTNISGDLNIFGNLNLPGLSNNLGDGSFSKLTKYDPGGLGTISHPIDNTRRYIILYIHYEICQGCIGTYNGWNTKVESGNISLGYTIQSNNGNTPLGWNSGGCCSTSHYAGQDNVCDQGRNSRKTKQLLVRGQHYDGNTSSLNLTFSPSSCVNFQWMHVRFLELL
jgi:hypothetical protein